MRRNNQRRQRTRARHTGKTAPATSSAQPKTLGLSDYFTILNVDEVTESNLNGVTSLRVHDRAITLISNYGCKLAWISIHATTLTNEVFSEESFLRDFLAENRCFLLISDSETDIMVRRPDIQHSLKRMLITKNPVRLKGNILVIMIMLNENETDTPQESQLTSRVCNSIRTAYGIGSVSEPVAEFLYNAPENTVSTRNVKSYVFEDEAAPHVDRSAYIQFESVIGKYPKSILMNPEADVMFSYALRERDPTRRFLFLWLCLECSHNGKERRNLFERKLHSTIANDEVTRLYEIRHNLFHEGSAAIDGNDCTSVLWAIRIAICQDASSQKAMCNAYEAWITERNTQ